MAKKIDSDLAEREAKHKRNPRLFDDPHAEDKKEAKAVLSPEERKKNLQARLRDPEPPAKATPKPKPTEETN